MKDLSILESVFDVVRIVNPKENIEMESNSKGQLYSLPYCNCFEVWKNGKVCENCISLKAIESKSTQVKFEVVSGRRYMVIAAPLNKNDGDYVIEMIMDITDNDLINDLQQLSGFNYYDVIENLSKVVVTDELTGVHNKRYIEEVLPYKLKQLEYNSNTIGLILIDIDYFKRINDTFGHVIGDEILKEVAGILSHEIRGKNDWIARYGGEEFLIFLSDMTESTFTKVCERMRKKIEGASVILDDQSISVTISLGCLLIDSRKSMEMKRILTYVDDLLYKSKELGRNCVTLETIVD